MRARFFIIVLAGLGLSCTAAHAGSDPPGRVARINYSEGAVGYAPAGDNEFVDADMNRPLAAGDKLWTDKGVRAEIQAGSAVVRMDGRTQLAVLAVDDQSTQLAMAQGSVYVRVRNLPEGENFEVDTPNLAWRASYPGDYRIDVDPVRGITRVTIHSGTGAVYGEKGDALPMGGGQQITFKERALAQVDSHDQPPDDNFDRWAQERNRRDDQSVAARYVPRDAVGYQLLDAKGEWRQDASFGVAWFPQGLPAKWAPYRNGHWEWIAPWGWTWIDEQPWAFVTSHYGRWTLVNSRWAWVPGRLGVRPVYAPALVAFVGSDKGPLAVGETPAVAWFPLAPGEAWRPTWDASPLYISSVNANMTPQPPAQYAYQSKPEAVTAIAAADFARGRPARGHWLRVAESALADAQVVAPPAMPEHAHRTLVAHAPQPPLAIKPAIDNRPAPVQQVVAASQPAQQAQVQREAQRQHTSAQVAVEARAQRERQVKAEQARAGAATQKLAQQNAAEQQKVAAQQKAADQQRQAERQKLAEQKRRDEQQKVTRAAAQRERSEQAHREAAARRAEQARQQAVAKREQAERRQALLREREAQRELAAAKQRAQRELQARRAQEAGRLAAAAKQEEQARQVAHAQQVEQARRAAERDAQVLAAQRAEREAALRRVADERERAQREAWQKQQQALAEQARRDQQRSEEQQRQKAALQQRAVRPDLRRVPAPEEPEVWQRGIPILSPGRTS